MAYISPQQQQWWQRFLQQQQAQYQSQIEALHAAQPWQQPGYTRFQNPLVGGNAPQFGNREADPGAAMMGYFMQGAMGGGQGGEPNPMMMEMMMGGSGGAL
jgi:hypothetical protein